MNVPPRQVYNMSILFVEYIARRGFPVHGGATLGHSGHYCNTNGL